MFLPNSKKNLTQLTKLKQVLAQKYEKFTSVNQTEAGFSPKVRKTYLS
jgi:hypothetical protein